MSHITKVKTNVEFKDAELLQKALESIGTVGNFITDYYGKQQNVNMSINTDQFQRGIGFIRNGDKFDVKLDAYGYDQQANNLLKDVQIRYQKEAVSKHLISNRYSVKVTEDENSSAVRIQARRFS